MAGMGGLAAAAAGRAGSTPKKAGTGDSAWIGIQKRVFTNWMNAQLEQVGTKLESFDELRSGVKLIQTVEVCSKKSVGKYSKAPKNKHQEVENLNIAFTFMTKEGLKFVNMQGADVWDGNEKLILGMIWTIIYHWQVSKGFKAASAAGGKKNNAKDLLLEWVRSKIPDYNIKNFSSDWNDGRALCALTNVIAGEPYVLPNHNEMSKESGKMNCKTGINTAKEVLGIPALIAPEDLSNPAIDEKSVVTYISYFKDATRKGDDGAKAVAAPAPAPVEEKKVEEEKAAAAPAAGDLPPPWERPAGWRDYKGHDLGGRCKIRIYWSSTTSSMQIRKNTEALKNMLEARNVHKRPDWETPVPIDVDFSKEQRDKLFEKAGGHRMTPMLFVDDEFIGPFEKVLDMNEDGSLDKIFEY